MGLCYLGCFETKTLCVAGSTWCTPVFLYGNRGQVSICVRDQSTVRVPRCSERTRSCRSRSSLHVLGDPAASDSLPRRFTTTAGALPDRSGRGSANLAVLGSRSCA